MREQLLFHLPWFVSAAAKLPGIRRIALLGSITTNKQNPKDIDFLVMVDDDHDLEYQWSRDGKQLAVTRGGFEQRPGADRKPRKLIAASTATLLVKINGQVASEFPTEPAIGLSLRHSWSWQRSFPPTERGF
jgi:hypothetical protein